MMLNIKSFFIVAFFSIVIFLVYTKIYFDNSSIVSSTPSENSSTLSSTINSNTDSETSSSTLRVLDNIDMASTTDSSTSTEILTSPATSSDDIKIENNNFKYVQVVDSCNYAYGGACLNVRSGPGAEFARLKQLRNGAVLQISDRIEKEDGLWYKVTFAGEKILDKTQLENDWYIFAKYTKPIYDVNPEVYYAGEDYGQNNKVIYVNISEQKLYAYENNQLFMASVISSGKSDTPSELGEYYIFYKTPSRYMQSTSTSATNTPYDLPGVPFDMYFNSDGSAIHGTYWHNSFGRKWSHGCVNMTIDESEKLYNWAPLGTKVVILK